MGRGWVDGEGDAEQNGVFVPGLFFFPMSSYSWTDRLPWLNILALWCVKLELVEVVFLALVVYDTHTHALSSTHTHTNPPPLQFR